MIKVEAVTLEEAYSKAASELSCSVTELELNVLQYPSSGFLGFGKKIAIVEARVAGSSSHKDKPKHEKNQDNKNENRFDSKEHKQDSANANKKNRRNRHQNKEKNFDKKDDVVKVSKDTKDDSKKEQNKQDFVKKENRVEKTPKQDKHEKVVNKKADKEPLKEKVNPESVVGEVKEGLVRLFGCSCFQISKIEVSVYNEDTLLIEFDGEDAALMIGKEGYRYKAISYLIYNWVNIKYGLNIRLEIAEFLKNQEEMIDSYLEGVVERINNQGRGQTKILDGVLIKIALEKLRAIYPEKYVGIKNGREGGRFIVVNDFNRKEK